jgi:hypothetical protein
MSWRIAIVSASAGAARPLTPNSQMSPVQMNARTRLVATPARLTMMSPIR